MVDCFFSIFQFNGSIAEPLIYIERGHSKKNNYKKKKKEDNLSTKDKRLSPNVCSDAPLYVCMYVCMLW